MNRHPAKGPLVVVPALLGISACAMFSPQGSGLERVDDLASRIERVHVEAELAKQEVFGAVESLHRLAAPDAGGDSVVAHQELMAAVARAREQSHSLRSAFVAMQAAAGPVFEQWSADLTAFANPELRHRSQARLEATRARYHDIVEAVEPALSTFGVFNVGIHDIGLFLGHDLNATSLAEVKTQVHTVNDLASELDGRFDRCLETARAYLESAALPARVAAPGPEPGRTQG